jgi:hypothetical protein
MDEYRNSSETYYLVEPYTGGQLSRALLFEAKSVKRISNHHETDSVGGNPIVEKNWRPSCFDISRQ